MGDIIDKFRGIAPTLRKNEVWRNVDFSRFTGEGLTLPQATSQRPEELYCNIPDLGTLQITLVNGYCSDGLCHTEEGVVYGSLREAAKSYAALVKKHLNKCTNRHNPYEQFNGENFTDGAFVWVPKGVRCTKPLQILSVSTGETPVFLQTRNLIVVESNAELTLLQCDDSYGNSRSMSNNVTEVAAHAGSVVRYYKLQNMNDSSALLNQNYVSMGGDAVFNSFAITFNGGHIRNHTEVCMHEPGTTCEVNGLYLIDHEQEVDNYVFVEHGAPHCTSNELFKGIIDDSATATFNGHVLVQEGAIKTEAYQSNRNIILTDKANIVSKPFLEIYNDDVKCSHGSTTGQIDEQALFYLRSRGISERTARTLLYYAFCDEVIQKIQLPTLRDRLSDMVKKRLHGELTACADCALHCSTPCGDSMSFHIDADKL